MRDYYRDPTPRNQRPDWKLYDADIKAKQDQERATAAEADKLEAKQSALDAKTTALDDFRAEHDRAQAEIVDPAKSVADGIAERYKQWQDEAKDLVNQAEKPLDAAEKRQRDTVGKRFRHSAAIRDVAAAKEQLQATFPASGDPGSSWERDRWRQRAITETVNRAHGHEAEQWRARYSPQDAAIVEYQKGEHQAVSDDLLSKLPRAQLEFDHYRKPPAWTDHLPDAGYQRKQEITAADQRWQSSDPAAVAESAKSWAAETQARHKHIGAALDKAAKRIAHQQQQLDKVPDVAAKAQDRLSELTWESSIRQAQPKQYRQMEEAKRQDVHAKAAQQRQEQHEATQERMREQQREQIQGPSQGHGRGM